MAGLNFADQLEKAGKRNEGKSMEHILGKGLLQPFSNTNSGQRKIMYSIHRDHTFPLMHGEKAVLETGYEIRFGDKSSSITQTDSDYKVVAKIPKFSFSPNHHYYLILEDIRNKRLDVVERVSYRHITEEFGYLYNNEYLDQLMPGNIIPNNTIIQKSMAFDEYNNRRDGVNCSVVYMALDDNMEDSMLISESLAKRMTSPLIKPVRIMINENDIPLNLYGNDTIYKSIPDIGEMIKDNILIALRKEKKEESLFSQSVQRLKEITISDEKRTLSGRVIDINIYCNNPENLNGLYNGQLKMYYDELQRMCSNIVMTVTPYVSQGYQLTYDLQKIFANAKRVNNKDQYIEKNLFSNIILDVVVLEERPLGNGDKMSNRYGGKGVISRIVPDDQMIKYDGGKKVVDVILNSSTMYNRENPGQVFELSINHVGCEIINKIKNSNMDPDDALTMIKKFISFISPEQAAYVDEYLQGATKEDRAYYVAYMMEQENIALSSKPISESMNIDRLKDIYDEFPWIEQNEIYVPIKGSNGQYRHVKARRRVVVGLQYMLRLKQFSEEKFSSTSLSSTNIRGENSKSKASKNYKEYFSNTPIRFGNMESNNLNHIGSEHVVVNLMIHSVSPHARRLVEQMYIYDPYDIDIKLDTGSTNRGAEIVSTYLKTIGKRIVFKKVKKKRKRLATIAPVRFNRMPNEKRRMISFVQNKENFDFEKFYMERKEQLERQEKDENAKTLVTFTGQDRNENGELL